MVDQAQTIFSQDELTPIQTILGPEAAYAPNCLAEADKYHIEPTQLAELVMVDITKQERLAANDQAKLAQLLSANNIQMLIQARAEQIATEEAREAIDMMGGDPSKVNSPNLPPDFKIPDYIIRTHPQSSGGDQSSIYAFASQFKGTHYVWGGTSLEHGCDCSGFVMGVFKKFGLNLDHSSQLQAKEIAKAAGTAGTMRNTSCNAITADQIPNNAVMTMGPKNGIGHVVIVTTNDKGERVVMQSMGGGVGVCEMPLEKFMAYLHRQPAGRTLQVADFGPLVQNLTIKPDVTANSNAGISANGAVSNGDYAPTPEFLKKIMGWEGFTATYDEKRKEIGSGGTAMDPVWAPYCKPGVTISESKNAELTAQSLSNRGAEIASYFPDFNNLPKGFQFALEDFSYNAGGPKLKHSEIMKVLLNSHGDVNKWKRAAEMLADGPFTSHGVEMAGLKKRCHERSEIALNSLKDLPSVSHIANNAATNTNLGNKTAHLNNAPAGNRIADPAVAAMHQAKVHSAVYAAAATTITPAQPTA